MVFADISGCLLASSFPKSRILLMFLGMFVRGVLGSKKTPCYFCDICGHFEASLGFFSSKVVNLVKFVFLELFATFVRGVLRTKDTLETNYCIYFYLN